jgi:hypothetical protein
MAGYFDGNAGYILTPLDINLDAGSYTLAAWAKRIDNTGDSNGRIIDFRSFNMILYPTGSFIVGNFLNADTFLISGANVMNHFCVIRAPAGNYLAYVNGSYIGSRTKTNDSGFTPMRIGGRAGDDRTFNGLVSDVRIYDVALSLKDIKNLYNNGSGLSVRDLGCGYAN